MEFVEYLHGKQNILRQERNILAEYPEAKIIKETYTGTKLKGRKEFENLLKIIKEGDTIVFDSVSRMSRNAEEGYNLYEELFNKGVNLIFLKEQHINTAVYKKALEKQIKIQVDTGNAATNKFINNIINTLSAYALDLAKEQIKESFNKAQEEVDKLHQRTREGMLTAKLAGKRIGTPKGTKLITKKSIAAKEIILKHCKTFNGTLSDKECIKLAGINKETYYIYKKQLKEELYTEAV